jgi:hypothetical protein
VSEDATTGKLSISFATFSGCPNAGAGQGVNAYASTSPSRYAYYDFHDLLLVTNKGQKATTVWVNATGSYQVAASNASGQMTDASYASAASILWASSGASFYVGVKVNNTAGAEGTTLAGTLALAARASG